MRSHKKYEPYVRLANGSERSDSLRVAVRIAFYGLRRKPFYVMVQRGNPNNAIEVGGSKREVQMSPATVAFGNMSFRQWASAIKKFAQGRQVTK